MAGVHEDWMERLEDRGHPRPGDRVPADHRGDGGAARRNQQGLTSPELSTLMSYTKIMLAREVLSSDLPDDPDLADRPWCATSRRRCGSGTPTQIREHRLSREIITTVLVNDFVNKAGITCYHRLSAETGRVGGRPDPGQRRRPADLRRRRVRGRDRRARPPDPGGRADRPAAGGPDPGRAGDPLAGQQPTTTDRHQRHGRLLRRDGVAALVEVLPRSAVGRDAEAYAKALKGYRSTGRAGRAGQSDRGAAVPCSRR